MGADDDARYDAELGSLLKKEWTSIGSAPSEAGHGHVTPNPDGSRARCGGPRCCPVCQREAAALRSAHEEAAPPSQEDPTTSKMTQVIRHSVVDQMKNIAGLLKLYVDKPEALDEPTRVFLAMSMANLGTFLVADAADVRRGE